MSGRLSGSERIMMEIDWFNESERQEVLNKINEKIFIEKGNSWSDNWDNDQYDDYQTYKQIMFNRFTIIKTGVPLWKKN